MSQFCKAGQIPTRQLCSSGWEPRSEMLNEGTPLGEERQNPTKVLWWGAPQMYSTEREGHTTLYWSLYAFYMHFYSH